MVMTAHKHLLAHCGMVVNNLSKENVCLSKSNTDNSTKPVCLFKEAISKAFALGCVSKFLIRCSALI